MTTRNGLAAVPLPVTSLWLTGVNGVLVPIAFAALRGCSGKSGACSASPTVSNAPQSPGALSGEKSSSCESPL